jgi:hypothetical protein
LTGNEPSAEQESEAILSAKSIDTIQAVLSDTHSGSNYALFLGRNWSGSDKNTHYPKSDQIKIREQFIKYAEQVKQARKGKRLRLIHNGDALDGDHHHSGDVCTTNALEQADIHIEIMQEFQKLIGWQRGDEIYYTRGTKVHVEQFENYIGREMNAIPCGDFFVHDFLELQTNGVSSWFVHHGPTAGAGGNEGNGIRNWLRNIQIDSMKDGDKCPDIVYTGHVHNPSYSSYVYRNGMTFKTMHGIITPSWQSKTTYAWMRAPVSKNKIGGVIHEIKADGTICVPQFSVMGY